MARVTGIGGIFFKSKDPEALKKWYRRHLGIESRKSDVGARFEWQESKSPTVRPKRQTASAPVRHRPRGGRFPLLLRPPLTFPIRPRPFSIAGSVPIPVPMEADMPVWLLEHKDPKAAQLGRELFERIVVRARDLDEARDLAADISPMPSGPDLEWQSVWSDPGKTTCDPVTDGPSAVLAVEMWGSPRRR